MLLSGGCAVLAFVVVRQMGWRGKFGSIHFGLFLGILVVFLGNASDGIYDVTLRATPFPSISDVLYLLGYAVVTVTLLEFLWFFRKAVNRKMMTKLIALLVISAGGLTVVYLLSHIMTRLPAVALDAAYPILDGFGVMLSVIMLVCFRSRFISPPWRWFALGMLLMGIGHFLNGLGNAEGWYSYPDPIDLLYLWGYVSLGLGFSMQTKPQAFWQE